MVKPTILRCSVVIGLRINFRIIFNKIITFLTNKFKDPNKKKIIKVKGVFIVY